jgi:hypothetical protein
MQRKWQIFRTLPALMLISLCGCASTHTVAVKACAQQAPQSAEIKEPAPPPLAFSKCLTEILQVGRGELAQISNQCSQLLGPLPTK